MREVHEVVAYHRFALVADVRQFDWYHRNENNVENCVQRVGEYGERHSERRGKRVLLVLLALTATLWRVLHIFVQFHDDGHWDERAEPRRRHYDRYEHHAETAAHEAFGAQWEEDDQTALERECHNHVVGETLWELIEQIEQLAGGVRVTRDPQREAIFGEQQQAVLQEAPDKSTQEQLEKVGHSDHRVVELRRATHSNRCARNDSQNEHISVAPKSRKYIEYYGI